MVIWWRVLTIVFGALPATWLSLWALLGMAFALAAIMSGALSAILFVIWGVAGIRGTITLWSLGFGAMRPDHVRGLVIGVVAILPLIPPTVPWMLELSAFAHPFAVPSVLPLLVAVAWLIVFHRQKSVACAA